MGKFCGVEALVNLGNVLVAIKENSSDVNIVLKKQLVYTVQQLKDKTSEEAAAIPIKMIPVILVFIMPLIMYPMLCPAITTLIIALQPVSKH